MKASSSDRMHQGKTVQKEQDSLPEGDCAPRRAVASAQMVTHVAQCCAHH